VGDHSELCQFFQGDLTGVSLRASYGDTASTREPREREIESTMGSENVDREDVDNEGL
jgi:hypothetical protein